MPISPNHIPNGERPEQPHEEALQRCPWCGQVLGSLAVETTIRASSRGDSNSMSTTPAIKSRLQLIGDKAAEGAPTPEIAEFRRQAAEEAERSKIFEVLDDFEALARVRDFWLQQRASTENYHQSTD